MTKGRISYRSETEYVTVKRQRTKSTYRVCVRSPRGGSRVARPLFMRRQDSLLRTERTPGSDLYTWNCTLRIHRHELWTSLMSRVHREKIQNHSEQLCCTVQRCADSSETDEGTKTPLFLGRRTFWASRRLLA